MKKTFKDLKAGDKVWLFRESTQGDTIDEITYKGKITTEPSNDKITDFDTKNYPGWVWYHWDSRPDGDATMLWRNNSSIYFNEEDAHNALKRRLANRWLCAHMDYMKAEQLMDSYFHGDENAIMEFKTKALEDEAKRVREWSKKDKRVNEE